MSKTLAITKKELCGYFRTPMGVTILLISVAIFNVFFFLIINQNKEAALHDIYRVMEFLFVFLVPLLTMRLLSQEKSTGTIEFLQTTPVRNSAIVIGKYIGSLAFFTLMLSVVALYYAVIEIFGAPDRAVVATGFLGVWLEGALFLAIGLLVSSLTKSQTVAAFFSYAIIFLLYFCNSFASYLGKAGSGVIKYLSLADRTANFISGLVVLSDVVFLITAVCFCLLLAQTFLNQRRRKLSTFIYILVLSAALIGTNYITLQYDQRFDVTKFKQHTLSDQTKSLLGDLKNDVRITVFYTGLPPKYLEDVLNSYTRFGVGKVTTEIVDPVEQIGYAAQFGALLQADRNKAIVQSGAQRVDVDFTETPLSENPLNNAIVSVTRPTRTVYFLTGHNEFDPFLDGPTGLSIFTRYLKANNITVRTAMLGTQREVPADCDLLVIAGAKNELTDDEQKRIKDYLNSGGDALLLIEHVIITTPDVPLREDQLNKNPSLNSLLEDWSLSVNTDVVVDIDNHAGQDVGTPATRNYLKHRAIVTGLDYTFYVRPRSISFLTNLRKNVKVAPLVLTSSPKNSWGETNRALEIKYDEGIDYPGPVPVAAVVWEAREGVPDTRIAVFTDADFLTNAYISQYSNAQMGLNVINWLTEADYQTFVTDDEIKVPRLDLTSRQKKTVVLILWALPLLILLGGLVGDFFRRN